MDITKLTIEQLKALIYDYMVQSQQIQSDVRIIEGELAKRQLASQNKEEEKK